MDVLGTLAKLWNDSGFNAFFVGDGWKSLVMIIVACALLYLGIVKKFEPLLLVGIAFGALLTNLPGNGLYTPELWDSFLAGEIGYGTIMHEGGLLDILYIGVKAGVYPSLIFMGVGAMTDFGPMMANPKSMLLGAAAPMLGIGTERLEAGIRDIFARKGEQVVEMNLAAFRAGYEYAQKQAR